MNTTTPRDAEEELLRRIAGLPHGIEPPSDLWPGIRARLGTPAGSRWPRTGLQAPAALAAGLLLAVSSALCGAWFGYGLGQRERAALPAMAYAPELERIEGSYAAARESVLRGIALGDAPMDPGSRQALRESLAVIDTAIGELHAAMASDPDNPRYLDALLMTREREIELLADLGPTTTLLQE